MLRHSRSESISKCPNSENDYQEEILKDHPIKQTNKKKRNFFKDYLTVYSSNTGLHGLKYIGENQRTHIERLFWLFAFICGCVLCAASIAKTYTKWNLSPVIVTFAEKTTPTWQIPYPAITICLQTKSRATVFNFTENYYRYDSYLDRVNMSEEERNMVEDLTLICEDRLASPTGREYSDENTITNIKSVTTNASSTFFMCRFKDRASENCTSLNARILTDEGVCFSFNILRPEDLFKTENLHKNYSYIEHDIKADSWSLDEGYAPDVPLDTYPHRGAGSTAKAGVAFLMQTNASDLDHLCKASGQGFKILVHNPAEFPRLNDIYFRASLNQELIISVIPKMITTTEELRKYDSERRQCYFSDERYLRYFKVYTQSNCELECLTNFTYSRCGCVNFWMPHDSSMKVCNTAKVNCMQNAKSEFSVVGAKKILEQNVLEENIDEAEQSAAGCNCLPGCSALTYEAETSQAEYDFKQLCKAYRVTSDDEVDVNLLMTRLSVFFKAPQFIPYRRSELFSRTDFVASCGGLLGLFIGFSFLSLAEILYFMTLRLCCVVYQRKRSIKKTKSETLPYSEIPDSAISKYNN